jgi:hypothetical protein
MPKKKHLSGFAQMYAHLYAWEPLSVEAVSNDLSALTSAPIDAQALGETLNEFQAVDSQFISGDESEYVYVHRISDAVVFRYVRNEPETASGWSQWRGVHEQVAKNHRHVHFGYATLLQCEGDVSCLNEDLRSALSEALTNSPDYSRFSLQGCVALPFGYLFELVAAKTVWVLVNKPEDARAAEWMTVDWLRLTTFIKKNSHYVRLFEREIGKLSQVITDIEAGKIGPQFNPDRASILLERSRDECGVIFDNLRAAERGYSNALEDTLGVGTSSAVTIEQHFLFRILGQLHWASEVSRKRLESLRDRWPGVERSIRVAKPKVQGDFFWSYVEEVTIARYVDCRCSAILSMLDQIRACRGKGFGPENQSKNVAKDIYNWLREHEEIVYDFEPVQPQRVAQLIRKHSDVLRTGTCIDLSCLYAALLEGAYQRPVLVHYLTWVGPNRDDWEGHMVCGLWLIPLDLSNPTSYFLDELICKKVDEFRDRVQDGSLLIVECMGFSKGDKAKCPVLDTPFDDAIHTGKQEALGLPRPVRIFNFAVDIKKCRDFDIQAIQQD